MIARILCWLNFHLAKDLGIDAAYRCLDCGAVWSSRER